MKVGVCVNINYKGYFMRKLNRILLVLTGAVVVACGSGQTNTGTNYYSAAYDTYYQIESSLVNNQESYFLNIISTGNQTNKIPLTLQSNGIFTFNTNLQNQSTTGYVLATNGNLGIAFNSTSGSYYDFASTFVNSNQLPSGSYVTVCDQNNLSACTITVNGNLISITEYNQSGSATALCANSKISKVSSSNINPYLYSFGCGVDGGSASGTWYIAPLTINGVTGFMINEYNNVINASDDGTDEIAFPQGSINPQGNYFYVANGILTGSASIGTAIFSGNTLNNPTVGNCSGAPCAIVPGYFYNYPMSGFSYYSVNNTVNYNLVGNDTMGLYQDSYEGIYY